MNTRAVIRDGYQEIVPKTTAPLHGLPVLRSHLCCEFECGGSNEASTDEADQQDLISGDCGTSSGYIVGITL